MSARPRFTSRQQAFASQLALLRARNEFGADRIAAAVGVRPVTVLGWIYCPTRHVGAVAATTGVPAHELRPDLFPASAPAPSNDAEQATAAHLAAARHFALTGRTLSSERH